MKVGFNYYNNSLWIGPEGDKDGKGHSILINRDRHITNAKWINGTISGPVLEIREEDQEGYIRNFQFPAIPSANEN